MESRGRRAPRVTAPADPAVPEPAPTPMAAAASEAAETPIPPQGAQTRDQPTPEPTTSDNVEEPSRASRPSPPQERRSSATSLSSSLSQAEPSEDVERDLFAIIAEARKILARGVESMSDELASFARQSIDTTALTAIQMLEVKTWADAVAINTNFARTSYDHWLESAAKVSELGVKLAFESSQPFVSRIGKVLTGVHPGG